MVKSLHASKPPRGPCSNLWSLTLCLTILPTAVQPAALGAANVLIYTATRAYRHDSIPTAVEALISRSAGHNITFENTEDLTWFGGDRLEKYDAIVFLSTTGDGESLRSYSPHANDIIDVLSSPRCGG